MFVRTISRFSIGACRAYFKKQPQLNLQKIKKYVEISRDLTLDGLAEKIGVSTSELTNAYLDIEGGTSVDPEILLGQETIEILINEFNCLPIWLEQEKKVYRPPVVTIMGHVDHGKTTLLDSLRNSSICATEYGGITQSIGAFSVKASDGQNITFIDTPGHLAFSDMRARGAEITDIIVLVVCAVEGVQPQTIECIEHAKSWEVPIIVALNKVDLSAAEVERVEMQLLKAGLELDKFGGDVLHVPISAKKKTNIEKLEEAILFKSELMELKDVKDVKARGYVLESKFLEGRGSLCSVIIKRGTLNVGDCITAGGSFGMVKRLVNENGKELKSISLSEAAELIGFRSLPNSGDHFMAVHNIEKAQVIAKRKIAERTKITSLEKMNIEEKFVIPTISYNERQQLRNRNISPLVKRLKEELENVETGKKDSLEVRSLNQMHKKSEKPIQEQIDMISEIFQDKLDENGLRLILKAQNFGMLEAVEKSVKQIEFTKKVPIAIIKCEIGSITQEDVEIAKEFDAPIFCMNIRLDKNILSQATKAKVPIKSHKIIYHLLEDIEKIIKDKFESKTEIVHGKALVKNIFVVTQGKSNF